MSKPTKQVGGTHYQSLAIDPYEYAARNRLGFLEGNAIKYLTRHHLKNGEEDLRKALHTIERLIELKYPEPKPRKRRTKCKTR